MPAADAFFALAVRGLELVVKDEVVSRLGDAAAIRDVSYRKVVFSYRGPMERLLELRTADDVFFYAREFKVTHLRQSLAGIKQQVRSINEFPRIMKKLGSIRLLPAKMLFSITVSNIGKKNYGPIEVKAAIAEELTAKYGWEYSDDDARAAINLRVFIDKCDVLMGVRVAQVPLHRRSYKRYSLPGSLKASVANCLLSICGVGPTDVFLDPMCGVGTIAIEALHFTAHVMAGDINPEAVRFAQQNARGLRQRIVFREWDARHTQLDEAGIDCIVTNLPFDKQVKIEHDKERLFPEIIGEMERILKPAGRAVLLTIHRAELTRAINECGSFEIVADMEISLFGETPHIIKMVKTRGPSAGIRRDGPGNAAAGRG